MNVNSRMAPVRLDVLDVNTMVMVAIQVFKISYDITYIKLSQLNSRYSNSCNYYSKLPVA